MLEAVGINRLSVAVCKLSFLELLSLQLAMVLLLLLLSSFSEEIGAASTVVTNGIALLLLMLPSKPPPTSTEELGADTQVNETKLGEAA